MRARGAEPIADMGISDVSEGNVIGDFETWLDHLLWPALQKDIPAASTGPEDVMVEAEVSTKERATRLRQDVQVGTVKDVKVLTAPGEPQKYHMEISLPPESCYECGDYLAVLPQNPEMNVRKVMAHFELPWDATVILKSESFAPLPLQTTLSVSELLRNYYELSQPATQRVCISKLLHCPK